MEDGGGRKKRGIWEEEEREKGCLALPPGLDGGRDGDVGWRVTGGGGDVLWGGA